MLIRAAKGSEGDVEIQNVLAEIAASGQDLTNAQKAQLERLNQNVTEAMQELKGLTGQQLLRAFKKKDQTFLNKIDTAIETQRTLADAIRSMRFKQLDETSLNTSEAIDGFKGTNQSTVKDMLKNVLDCTTVLPFTLEHLTSAITGFPQGAQNRVIQKAADFQTALDRLNQTIRGIGFRSNTVDDAAVSAVNHAIDGLIGELRSLKTNGRRDAWIAHYNHGIDTLLPQLEQLKASITANCNTLNGYSESLDFILQQAQPALQMLQDAGAQLPNNDKMETILTGTGLDNVLSSNVKNAIRKQFQHAKDALLRLAHAADGAAIETGISRENVSQAASSVRKLAEELYKANLSAHQPLESRETMVQELKQLAEDIENKGQTLNSLSQNPIEIISDKLAHISNEKYSMALEALADRCDQRAAEITSAVVSILDYPAIDEIKETISRLPFNATTLNTAISGCPADVQNDIRKKLTKAQNALNQFNEGLDKIKSLKSDNLKEKDLAKASDALYKLADALCGLHGSNPNLYTDQIDAWADSLYAQAAKLGSVYTARLQCLSESIFSQADEARAKMHGTVEAIRHYMGAPMDNLNNFVKNPNQKWTLDKILAVQTDFVKLQDAITEISDKGALTLEDGSAVQLDRQLLQKMEQELFQPLKDLLAKASEALKKNIDIIRKECWITPLDTLMEMVFPTFGPDPELLKMDFFREAFPIMTKLGKLSEQYRSLQKEIFTDSTTALEKLKALNHSMIEEINRITVHDYAQERGYYQLLRTRFLPPFNASNAQELGNAPEQMFNLSKALTELHKMEDSDFQKAKAAIQKEITQKHPMGFNVTNDNITQSDDIIWLLRQKDKPVMNYCIMQLETLCSKIDSNVRQPDVYLEGTQLRQALIDGVSFATVIESMVNGASPDMIDPLCDDKNLVETRVLNDTGRLFECTYKTGNDERAVKVFKPEISAYVHNFNLNLGASGLTSNQVQVAMMNIATVKCAELLNSSELFPKTSVGTLNGTYGTFMDKVQGKSLRTLFSEALEDQNAQRLGAGWSHAVRGKQMKKCNKLQWMDQLMGQCDRHGDNYFIDVKDNEEVSLKGIDNDFCLLENKPSIWKIAVSNETLRKAVPVVFNNSEENFLTFLRTLMEKDALQENPDGELIFNTQQMTPLELGKLHKITGCNNFKVPDYMDEDIYSALMELDANAEKKQDLIGCLPDISQRAKNDFLFRLDEMIALAKTYKDNDKVLNETQWCNARKQEEMERELENRGLLVKKQRPENENDSQFYEQLYCLDLYFRDLGYHTVQAVNPVVDNSANPNQVDLANQANLVN